MKNKFIKYILVIFITFICLFSFNKLNNVKADSGWDSDYDSGSSFDSSSSWDSGWDSDYDSGSSWDSNTNRSSSSTISRSSTYPEEEINKRNRVGIYLFCLFIGVPVLLVILKAAYMVEPPKSERDITKIKDIIPNFDIEKFKEKAYKTFYDVQIAWMEFDYEKLKDLLSDELFNSYVMDLDTLKIKNQKNTMKDFDLVSTDLIDLKEENNKYIAKIQLEVKFYDYIEDINTHKVLRGTNKIKLDNTYILTFERTKKEIKDSICPSCGASVEGNSTGVCEYCKSKLINNTYDWILVKKEKISQK